MNTKATRLTTAVKKTTNVLLLMLLLGLLATPAQAQTGNDTADLPNLEQFLDGTIER